VEEPQGELTVGLPMAVPTAPMPLSAAPIALALTPALAFVSTTCTLPRTGSGAAAAVNVPFKADAMFFMP